VEIRNQSDVLVCCAQIKSSERVDKIKNGQTAEGGLMTDFERQKELEEQEEYEAEQAIIEEEHPSLQKALERLECLEDR